MTKSCFLFFLPLLPLPPLQIPYPQKHTLVMELFLASLLPSSDIEKKLCTSNFKQGLFCPKKRKQNPQLFSKSELREFLAPSNLRKSSRKIFVFFFEIRINPHPVFRISCTIFFLLNLENSPSKKNKKKKKERIVLPQNSICIVENPTSVLDENTDLWA